MAQGRFTPPAAGYKPLSLISAISVWAARPPPATPSPLRPLAPPIPMPAIESRATEAALPPAPTGTAAAAPRIWLLLDDRSEEHTSELQSLMRISYAVFCLKHKINNIQQANTIADK